MALSGTISHAHSGWTLKVEWSATQSLENNTSTITCVHKLVCAKGYNLSVSSRSNRCYVDGTPVYYTSAGIETPGNQTITLGTTKHTVQHESDGTKSCQITSYYYVRATLSGTYTEYFYARDVITLDTIARASQPSLITWPENTQDVGEFGDTIDIFMNRKSAAYTHTVRYEFGSATGTIATGVTNDTKWTIPKSLMNLIPNSTSGSGRVYVDTYDGSTLIGTKYSGFTATVPADVKPDCTATREDVTGIEDVYGSPVQGLSKIKVTVNATTAYSSPIRSYSIIVNDEWFISKTGTSGYLKSAGVSTVIVSATDTRGRTGEWSYDMNVKPYAKPSISQLEVRRCDEDGTTNEQGEYVKVTFSGTVSSLENQNEATYLIKYKKTSGTEWTVLGTDVNGNSTTSLSNQYSVSNSSFVFKADGSSAWDVSVTAMDLYGSSTRTTSVSTAFSLINFHESGTGLRFGGVADKEKALQNDLDLIQMGNQYCYGTNASNVLGSVAMAKIEITNTNANAPITFELSHRSHPGTMRVHVRFYNTSDLTPSLNSIVYEGYNFGAFLVNDKEVETSGIERGSVWTLYVGKVYANDWITVQRVTAPTFMNGRYKITYPGGVVTAIPNPFYRATPAKTEQLIDIIFPVGFVLMLYNHADPNDMYPGTTWVRIENRFLWATTAGGTIGQTGGESTHVLTTSEMPSHRHTIRWNDANNPAVSLSNSNASGNGTSGTGYIASYTKGTVYTDSLVAENVGGGAAHNNMPPYVQVSIWHRKA